MPEGFGPRVREMMARGIRERVFPGGVLAVYAAGKTYLEAFGWQEYLPRPVKARPETYYDLASLTKPLATALCFMRLVSEGKLSLDEPLSLFFLTPHWWARVTLKDLLSHRAGFPAHHPYFARLVTYPLVRRKEILRTWILKETPSYPRGKKILYSDLGFILLGLIIERVTGQELASYFAETISLLGLSPKALTFRPDEAGIPPEEVAATELCPWRGKLIKAEVHDENAWAAGGALGHAGLFGRASAVLSLLRKMLSAYLGQKEESFLTRETVSLFWDFGRPGEFALGFDRPKAQGSSAGRFFSERALGHLGFTGTSFWLEPERELIVVFLSNRVHPHREPNRLKAFRPALHDLIFKELGLLSVKD